MPKKPLFIIAIWAMLLSYATAVTLHTTRTHLSDFMGNRNGILVVKNEDNGGFRVISIPTGEQYDLPQEQSDYDISDPEISPDGNYIIYNCAVATDDNRMVIRGIRNHNKYERYDLGPGWNPHWWINPSSGDTFIVFASTKHLENGKSYQGETYRQELKNFKLTGKKEPLIDKIFTAGLSKDGRWIGSNKAPLIYDINFKRLYLLTDDLNASSVPYQISPSNNPGKMGRILLVDTLRSLLIIKDIENQTVWSLPLNKIDSTGSAVEFLSANWSNIDNYLLVSVKMKDNSTNVFVVSVQDKKTMPLCASTQQDLWFEGVTHYTTNAKHKAAAMKEFEPTKDMAFVSVMGSTPSKKKLKGFQRAVLYNAKGAVLKEFDISKTDSIYSLDRMIQENKTRGPIFIRMFK